MKKETQCQAILFIRRGKPVKCLEDLNDDDRRWCGKDTKICRECAFDNNKGEQQ